MSSVPIRSLLSILSKFYSRITDTDKVLGTFVSLFLFCYGGNAAPKLPNFMNNLFKNSNLFRVFIVSLVAFGSTSQYKHALGLTLIFLGIMIFFRCTNENVEGFLSGLGRSNIINNSNRSSTKLSTNLSNTLFNNTRIVNSGQSNDTRIKVNRPSNDNIVEENTEEKSKEKLKEAIKSLKSKKKEAADRLEEITKELEDTEDALNDE